MRKFLVLLKVPPKHKPVGDKLAEVSLDYCNKWGYEFHYEHEVRDKTIHPSLDNIDSILYYLKNPNYDFDWLYTYGPEGVCSNHTISLENVIDKYTDSQHNLLTMYLSVLPLEHPLPFLTKLDQPVYGVEFKSEVKNIILHSLFIRRCPWSIAFFEAMKLDDRMDSGIIKTFPVEIDRFGVGLQNYFDGYPHLHFNWKNIPMQELMSFPVEYKDESFEQLNKDMRVIDNTQKKFNPKSWISIITCTSTGPKNEDILKRIEILEKDFIK